MINLKLPLIFLLGAGAGAGVTWYVLDKRYAMRSEADILSVKEAFHTKEEELKNEINDLKQKLNPNQAETDISSQILSKGNILDYAKGKYAQFIPASSKTDDDISGSNNFEAPYVITPEEFGEMDGYTQISLTFYADGILADENGVIIDNVEEIVGDGLEHFGEYEDDSVFCRSDPKRCDYEILKDLRRYADVQKSFPHNL